jgi:hypothetical protein
MSERTEEVADGRTRGPFGTALMVRKGWQAQACHPDFLTLDWTKRAIQANEEGGMETERGQSSEKNGGKGGTPKIARYCH